MLAKIFKSQLAVRMFIASWIQSIPSSTKHPEPCSHFLPIHCSCNISDFSCITAWKWKVKVLIAQSCQTLGDPVDYTPLGTQSMELSRQEYCSGLPFSSPGALPSPGFKLRSPALQADSLPSEPPGKPWCITAWKRIDSPIYSTSICCTTTVPGTGWQ